MNQAEMINQLKLLNENIKNLTDAIAHQSFWDSQLFAATLGASSVLVVLIVQQVMDWRNKRNQRLEKIYTWMSEQIDFFDPKCLFKQASSTSYQCTVNDNKTGKIIEKIPEKPIGEKMVIELRTNVKYWRFPSFKLSCLFKRYEKSLLEFNEACDINQVELAKYFSKSNELFEKLKKLAFDKTGENEWTC